jgi:hypothetical protein
LQLKNLRAVEAFAEHVRAKYPALHILINNAAQTIARYPTLCFYLLSHLWSDGLFFFSFLSNNNSLLPQMRLTVWLTFLSPRQYYSRLETIEATPRDSLPPHVAQLIASDWQPPPLIHCDPGNTSITLQEGETGMVVHDASQTVDVVFERKVWSSNSVRSG